MTPRKIDQLANPVRGDNASSVFRLDMIDIFQSSADVRERVQGAGSCGFLREECMGAWN